MNQRNAGPPYFGDPAPATIIDPAALPDDQRHQALTYADEQEWLVFEHITPGRPSERRYVIEVAGVVRMLPPAEVLAYVRGQCDARGLPNLMPPREDTPPS